MVVPFEISNWFRQLKCTLRTSRIYIYFSRIFRHLASRMAFFFIGGKWVLYINWCLSEPNIKWVDEHCTLSSNVAVLSCPTATMHPTIIVIIISAVSNENKCAQQTDCTHHTTHLLTQCSRYWINSYFHNTAKLLKHSHRVKRVCVCAF